MKRLHTLRLGYLYIFGGSALLSVAFLFAVYRVFVWLYSRYTSDSTALFVRLSHWLINHIGKGPSAFILFSLVFTGIFFLRSQKAADDLNALRRATHELADKGSFQELKVLSGGELGEMADHLRRINRSGMAASPVQPDSGCNLPELSIADPNRFSGPAITGKAVLNTEEVMALILRTRALLSFLHEAEAAGGNEEGEMCPYVEAAKHEAIGMERFLKNLIAES